MVLFRDSLILHQIDDTEISNSMLLYLITFLSPFSHLPHPWLAVLTFYLYQKING